MRNTGAVDDDILLAAKGLAVVRVSGQAPHDPGGGRRRGARGVVSRAVGAADTCLIGRAAQHGGRLVTVDGRLVRLAAAPKLVEVLTADP